MPARPEPSDPNYQTKLAVYNEAYNDASQTLKNYAEAAASMIGASTVALANGLAGKGSAQDVQMGGSSSQQSEPEVRILASNNTFSTTAVLGDEFDDALRAKLLIVLQERGAASVDTEHYLAGSQDFETLEVIVDGRNLRVEAETFVGLSISGPPDLVEKVCELTLR
ncbi:MAG: hypothetical protein QM749_15365 [Aquabacterium sp.]